MAVTWKKLAFIDDVTAIPQTGILLYPTTSCPAGYTLVTTSTEFDYMEYANDAAARAAYVTSDEYGSDVLVDGTATADTTEGANVAARACDDNTDNWWTSTNTAYPHWWKYDLGVGVTKIVTKLRIYPNMIDTGVGIKNFTLQGSNNDADWDVLLTDITINSAEWQDFTFTNTTAYRYYKINVTDDWDAGFNFCSIKEIEMLESVLQCYSEDTTVQEGTYSLKVFAKVTDSLNDTLTRTVDPTIDLSDVDTLYFYIYSSRTGGHIKVGIHDAGGTTTEKTHTVAGANGWELVTWDVSGVSNANKDAIDSIIVTITNADAETIFYLDDFKYLALDTMNSYYLCQKD